MSSTIHYGIELENSFITKASADKMLSDRGEKFPPNMGSDPYYHHELGVFIPLISDGQVIAYFNGPISSIGTSNFVLTASVVETLSNQKTLKLLPQTVKALKSVPAGSRISPGSYNGYSYRSNGAGMKLRSSEVLKAMLLGYIDIPTDNNLILAIANSNYDLATELGTKPNKQSTMSLAAKTAKVDKYLNGKNSNNQKVCSEWQQRSMGKAIGYDLFRSSKPFDANHEMKWRKPAKTSLWPWTLDHHWFEVQESPITMANYAYKALLSGSSNRHKAESVNQKYPVFNRQLTMDYGRKVLELFFNESLKNKSAAAWGQLTHMLSNNMEWVVVNPYYAIPKLCLTLGVIPKFNESGVFEKFVGMEGNATQPTKKVYLEAAAIDVDNSHKIETMLNLTMALCYEMGIISLDTLEKSIGLVNAGEGLGNSEDYVHVEMGKHLICCIPKSYSYDVGRKQICKVDAKILADGTGEGVDEDEDI